MDAILKQTIIDAKKKRAEKLPEDEDYVRKWALGIDNLPNNVFKNIIAPAAQRGQSKAEITEYVISTPHGIIEAADKMKIAYDTLRELDGIEVEFVEVSYGAPKISLIWHDIEEENQ